MIRETPDVIGCDCSIHTLQLSIADLFKNKLCTSTIDEASRKCHELAVFVGRSGQRIDDLREACKRTNTKFLKLQKANATSSVATKLQRSSKLRRFLSEDPSSSSSSVHFQMPKNLRSFKDFRLKVTKIFWENLTILCTKLSEKVKKYVLFLKF